MSFEDEFLDCMTGSITVKTLSSIDGYGKETFATSATTYAALIQEEQQLVRAFDGTEQMAETTAHINSTAAISPDAEFTVAGDTRPVLAIQTLSDQDGVHHVVVHFGRRVS